MKKALLCFALAAVCAIFSACEVTLTDNAGSEQVIDIKLPNQMTDDDIEPTEEMKNHEGVYALSFVAMDGKKLYLPDHFVKADGTYFQIHSGKMNTNDTIYEWITHEWFYDEVHDPSTYDEKSVEGIMQESFEKMMSEAFPAATGKPALKHISKKKVDVKGFNFLRHTGYLECDGLPKMYYTVYFGVTDSGLCDNVPIEWLVFSECTDDNTKAEVQYIADTIANEFEAEKKDRSVFDEE